MMGRDSSESALEELECFFVVYLVYDLLLLSLLLGYINIRISLFIFIYLLFFCWIAGLPDDGLLLSSLYSTRYSRY